MRNPVDTCLYGSVVGMTKLLSLDAANNQSTELSPKPQRSSCDECEQRPANVSCDDCGLLYCAECDDHRHRKGKLQVHSRVPIRVEKPKLEEKSRHSVAKWDVRDVCQWLTDRDLEVFVQEAQKQQLNGRELLSTKGLDRFLDEAAGVSRGYKKKLQREAHKLQSSERPEEQSEEITKFPAPSPPDQRATGTKSIRLVDLRVDVQPPAKAAPTGRRMKLPIGMDQLKIDVEETGRAKSATPKRSSGGARQHVRGLGLDIAQVKKEEKTVASSFDFSATGRLQTQGFEINTRGIANVPFGAPQQRVGIERSPSTDKELGARDYLLLLNELGHGAGGKVYKALYMPTFRLVAVKVIRVFDQTKRHQMVRELKSLYANFVPLASATVLPTTSTTAATAQAACEELVVFYDAYTNPEVGSVSIVLEYMDGGSLEDYVQSAHESNKGESGCLSEKEIANVAACGLKGLAFLHEHHQLHRDIKLSNMLINYQGQVK
ncbi:Mitogen-activated protein kinase kinase 5, partial [Phytophthora boehmeriae]